MPTYSESVLDAYRQEAMERYHHLISPWRFTVPQFAQRERVLRDWLAKRRNLDRTQGG